MAKNKLASLCASYFIVLILSHHVLFTQARHLKCKKCRGNHFTSNSRNVHNIEAPSSLNAKQHKPPLVKENQLTSNKVVEILDEFRPTTPGRSPGAGH